MKKPLTSFVILTEPSSLDKADLNKILKSNVYEFFCHLPRAYVFLTKEIIDASLSATTTTATLTGPLALIIRPCRKNLLCFRRSAFALKFSSKAGTVGGGGDFS